MKSIIEWHDVNEELPSGRLLVDEDTNFWEAEEYLVRHGDAQYATVAYFIDGKFMPINDGFQFAAPVTLWAHSPRFF